MELQKNYFNAMIYLLIIVLAGLYNLNKLHQLFKNKSSEEMPHKLQGYFMAFLMGCIITGLPLSFLWFLISLIF